MAHVAQARAQPSAAPEGGIFLLTASAFVA